MTDFAALSNALKTGMNVYATGMKLDNDKKNQEMSEQAFKDNREAAKEKRKQMQEELEFQKTRRPAIQAQDKFMLNKLKAQDDELRAIKIERNKQTMYRGGDGWYAGHDDAWNKVLLTNNEIKELLGVVRIDKTNMDNPDPELIPLINAKLLKYGKLQAEDRKGSIREQQNKGRDEIDIDKSSPSIDETNIRSSSQTERPSDFIKRTDLNQKEFQRRFVTVTLPNGKKEIRDLMEVLVPVGYLDQWVPADQRADLVAGLPMKGGSSAGKGSGSSANSNTSLITEKSKLALEKLEFQIKKMEADSKYNEPNAENDALFKQMKAFAEQFKKEILGLEKDALPEQLEGKQELLEGKVAEQNADTLVAQQDAAANQGKLNDESNLRGKNLEKTGIEVENLKKTGEGIGTKNIGLLKDNEIKIVKKKIEDQNLIKVGNDVTESEAKAKIATIQESQEGLNQLMKQDLLSAQIDTAKTNAKIAKKNLENLKAKGSPDKNSQEYQTLLEEYVKTDGKFADSDMQTAKAKIARFRELSKDFASPEMKDIISGAQNREILNVAYPKGFFNTSPKDIRKNKVGHKTAQALAKARDWKPIHDATFKGVGDSSELWEGAANIDERNTGFFDAFITDINKYTGFKEGTTEQENSANLAQWSIIRTVASHEKFGATLSAGETKRDEEAYGTKNQTTTSVLGKYKNILLTTKGKLLQAYNYNDVGFHLEHGEDLKKLNEAIRRVDTRLEYAKQKSMGKTNEDARHAANAKYPPVTGYDYSVPERAEQDAEVAPTEAELKAKEVKRKMTADALANIEF